MRSTASSSNGDPYVGTTTARVGDVEVHVARGHDAAVGDRATRPGRRERSRPRAAGPRASTSAPSSRRSARSTSRFGSSLARGSIATTTPGPHEARDGVDVPVGVVVEQAVAEPQDLLGAERAGHGALDLVAAHRRVAVGVEQALARRRARSPRRRRRPRRPRGRTAGRTRVRDRAADDRRDALGDAGVVLEHVLASPAVERKADGAPAAGPVPRGRWAPCRAARCRRRGPGGTARVPRGADRGSRAPLAPAPRRAPGPRRSRPRRWPRRGARTRRARARGSPARDRRGWATRPTSPRAGPTPPAFESPLRGDSFARAV